MTQSTGSAARRAAYRLGHRAEWFALLALVLRGYVPVAHRVSLAGGEIDLIVRRGGTLAFVEVKARARLDEARDSIGPVKRRRFSKAVRAWVSRHPSAAGMTLRADAVFVGGRGWPEHCPAAFTIEGL